MGEGAKESSAAVDAPLLTASAVSVRIPGQDAVKVIVDDASLVVRQGEALGLVGESGSGKTMLVRSLLGLVPRTAVVEGEVGFKGRPLGPRAGVVAPGILGREIAMVFQDPMTSLNPVRRIGKQVTDPMRLHLGIQRAEARERAVELLQRVGIPEPARRLRQYPHHLSGGMRQRVCIAIALACEPALLIADEPTTALDVTIQRQILDLLGSLQAELGMAMLLISHDVGVVATRCDKVAVMYAGRIVEVGPAAEVLQSPCHRYTEALLRARPRAHARSHTPLHSIPGQLPSPDEQLTGCRFAPRCGHASARCTECPLPREETSPGHVHECVHPADGTGTDRTAGPQPPEPVAQQVGHG